MFESVLTWLWSLVPRDMRMRILRRLPDAERARPTELANLGEHENDWEGDMVVRGDLMARRRRAALEKERATQE